MVPPKTRDLARGVAPALARAMSGALALEDTPQGYLEALAVAKAVPLVAEPMAEHLVRAVLTIANADLERTEQGLTQSARNFLYYAYRIRVEALERAADDAKRALRELERGDAEWVAAAVAAAEAETERMYRLFQPPVLSPPTSEPPRRRDPQGRGRGQSSPPRQERRKPMADRNDADPTPMSS